MRRMARVPENERWEIVVLYFRGKSQRKIAEATGRTVKTANSIERACKSCRRIKDAPRKPRSRVTTEQEDAWIVAAAALMPGLSAQQIKNTLDLRASVTKLTGNVRKNWQLFKQRLDLFLTATSTDHPNTDAVKAAILQGGACDEALQIEHLGVATKALQIDGTTRDTSFIVKKGRQVLIGLNACIDCAIVTANIDSTQTVRTSRPPM
ncbi:hypothetical protein HPB52_012712 [Rhipicephalus sanguineus]|uniref:Tick transposon n=1 Tax=Rhipicephalus sanguineus TaxID=34632 RepID=A0A9D4PFG3_RHISA|nr:hypothetical protein HPB52_012712 [Rhipicephalus sanguineus]